MAGDVDFSDGCFPVEFLEGEKERRESMREKAKEMYRYRYVVKKCGIANELTSSSSTRWCGLVEVIVV